MAWETGSQVKSSACDVDSDYGWRWVMAQGVEQLRSYATSCSPGVCQVGDITMKSSQSMRIIATTSNKLQQNLFLQEFIQERCL